MVLSNVRLVVCVLMVASLGVDAAHVDSDHDQAAHQLSIPTDSGISLADALDAATERLRLNAWSEQRRSVAEARIDAGNAWLGDAPRIGGSWRDYDWNNDSDLYEAEVYLSMPLWRIGERRAMRALAAKDASLAPLQSQARQLASAGEVRSAYWQFLNSSTRYRLLQQLLKASEDYSAQVEARFSAGDVAHTELLQSRQQVLEFKGRLLDARAVVIDSSRRWRFVTGLDRIPARGREQPAPAAAIDERHPLLQLALAEVELARSTVDVIRNRGSQRPALSVNVKRETLDDRLPPLDSVGIGIDIPLGRGTSHRVDLSQSQQRLLEAEVELQTLRRQLQEDLHEVRHQAHVNAANLRDSESLLAIAQQVYQSQQLANAQGETSVLEVLRAGQALAEAQQRHRLLTLTADALVSQQNQVLGVLPE